ncbi:unnamed protein product, partial [Candidula unifasciata]
KSDSVSDTAGVVLAFASNIILAARNIALKKMQHEPNSHWSLVLKPWSYIALTIVLQSLLVSGLYVLEMRGYMATQSSTLVALALASGVFHVSYSYISTNIVLRVMNVVSHSVANIFKRLLVVLLLSALGTRELSASNFLGLGIALAGLLVYIHGKIGEDQKSCEQIKEDTTYEGEQHKTCVTFLLLVLVSVICLHTACMIQRESTSLTSSPHRHHKQEYITFHSLPEDASHIREAETDPEMKEFLSWRLVDHPEDTDKRSKTLTTNKEIVEEAQRILVNLMEDLLREAKHVMLIDIPVFENKGDPAIAAGEVFLLDKLNKTIVFHCEAHSCIRNLRKAIKVSKGYPKDDLVILLQGGGNLVGYVFEDRIRRKYIDAFPERNCILFSQSIWLHGKYSVDLKFARQTYSNRSNLVIFLRDRQSLEIAKKNFKAVRLILAPDLAFCIGMILRQMPPLYDIIWLRREDTESSSYTFPNIPDNISVNASDWLKWRSNTGNRVVENVFIIASEGFQFLQRGRIVVTDRLHGHILSTLLNIPHVIIDNPPYLKLSSFHKTWTQGLSNTILVSNGSQALDAALELLRRYENSLPSLSYREMFALT